MKKRHISKVLSLITIVVGVALSLAAVVAYLSWNLNQTQGELFTVSKAYEQTVQEKSEKELELEEIKQQLLTSISSRDELLARDEYKINIELESEIENINLTFKQAVVVYEELIKLRALEPDTAKLESDLAAVVVDLAQRQYKQAAEKLAQIQSEISKRNQLRSEQAAAKALEEAAKTSVKTSNNAPASGFSRQLVVADVGSFVVDIVAADMGSTKVIVDTASDGDCGNDCPVLSLAEYVSRNAAFAGINGTYFCPASYPSCAGKTNTFDLLLMNKNKTYFNSDNNVYSTNPVVIFGDGWVRFEDQALNWGRDTGVTGVISNYPLLVSGGGVRFGGDDDPKKGSRGNRSFVAAKGNTVYIGVVKSVTVAEAAVVLKTMGMEHAMNLDSGGSTALWSGGYKSGPGRNIPNAVLFVAK